MVALRQSCWGPVNPNPLAAEYSISGSHPETGKLNLHGWTRQKAVGAIAGINVERNSKIGIRARDKACKGKKAEHM